MFPTTISSEKLWSHGTRRRGLLVSRLIRFDHTDVLVSDHREYVSVSVATESRWRVVGKVLWWIERAR